MNICIFVLMSENKFDVVVIGSGPGGYVCAIRLAQLGFKTAIIEKYKSLGGTCLNVGCIPSKSLLDSSHHYEDIIKHAENHGIEISGKINLNFKKMIERKDGVVQQTVKGIDYLMNKNKITVFEGKASFVNNNTKIISLNDVGDLTYPYKNLNGQIKTLVEIFEGQNGISKEILNSKKPLIILGESFFKNQYANIIFHLIKKFLKENNKISDEWNSLNKISTDASTVGCLDLNIISEFLNGIFFKFSAISITIFLSPTKAKLIKSIFPKICVETLIIA